MSEDQVRRLKICGITRASDALLAAQLGVDYLGFIFGESPRRITPTEAAEIIRLLPERIEKVGVFLDQSEDTIRETIRACGLTMIQLHGNESPEFVSGFDLPVIKVLRTVKKNLSELIDLYETPFILLEPYVRGKAGGTGKEADWGLARQVVDDFSHKSIILAGGLGVDNVAEAVNVVRPYGVDASSRLEDSPGIKNHEKVKKFIEIVKGL
jgi:phosphoribosylanthranilate isomerase